MKRRLTAVMCYFLKTLILILSSLLTVASKGQQMLKVRLVVEDSMVVTGGLVIYPLQKDTVPIDRSTDIALLDLASINSKPFYFWWAGRKSKIFKANDFDTHKEILNISLPDTLIEFYKEFQRKKVCPVCLQKKYLKKYKVLGMPAGFSGTKRQTRANRKIIALACEPRPGGVQFYCEKDQFEF
jgi:hypothetical protein